MAELNGTAQPISAGKHLVVVELNGGTAKLEIKVDELDFQDVLNTTGAALFPADAQEIFTFGQCQLKATLTGAAKVSINQAD